MSLATGVKQATLGNGLTVLVKEVRTAPVATVWVWYKVGSRNEHEGITGCSHWVEHMLFKGGKRFQKGDIFGRIARVGGYNNGFTSHDYTVYFETLPAAEIELGMDIESDRMENAVFDPAEAASERTVIISEREGAENQNEFLLSEEVSSAAFRVHPYRWPVVGFKCDLEQMTRDDLYGYYRTYYGPNNAILTLVGDFDADEALQKAERLYGGIQPHVTPPQLRAVEPPQQGERRVFLRRPGSAAYLQVGYHVPAADHEAIYPLIMLDSILSGAKGLGLHGGAWMGRSSRLYRGLVDNGLATSAESSLPLSADPSLFSFWATARADIEPERVEEALLAELARITVEPPTAPEMTKVLRQMRAQLAYGMDGVTSQAFALGLSSCIATYDYLDRLEQNLARVKPEDVQRVAATYLKADNRTVGWFIPTGEEATGAPAGGPKTVFHYAPPAAAARTVSSSSAFSLQPSALQVGPSLPVERFPLSHGGVLLVCPSPNTPAVSISASLPAGGVRETDALAGLAHFTGDMLLRGTERHTSQEIADLVESLGASLSFGSSLEEAFADAKCMSEDLGTLLGILADCWRRPSFPESEIEKVRSETLTGIKEQKDDTRTVAEQAFRRLLYPPGHPYGRKVYGEEETVAAISREQIAGFHRSYFSPDNMILVVVGDVQPKAVLAAVETAFSGWQPQATTPPQLPAVVRRSQPERTTAAMPHKSQSDIVIGFPAIARAAADYPPADLACLIVGRLGLMGRLGKSVRDQQGLAYYVFSRLVAFKYGGHWVAQAGVNPKNVERAREGIWAELRRLAAEPVSEEELADAKSNQIGSLALRLETDDGIAGMIREMEYYGLGQDYLRRLPGIVRALTREQLLEAVQRYLIPDAAVEEVSGPTT